MKSLALALAVSMAVHGTLYVAVRRCAVGLGTTKPRAEAGIDLEIVEGAEPKATGSLSAPAKASSRRRAVVPRPTRVPAPVAREAGPADPGPQAPAASAALASDRASAGPPASGPPASGPPASGPPASGPPAPALDLRPFLARLRAAAHQCAGEHTGTISVRFCVDPAGSPQDVSVVASTGDAVLAAKALDCVIPRAAPFPLTDRCLVVPLAFR